MRQIIGNVRIAATFFRKAQQCGPKKPVGTAREIAIAKQAAVIYFLHGGGRVKKAEDGKVKQDLRRDFRYPIELDVDLFSRGQRIGHFKTKDIGPSGLFI
ncbi:MAG: hypothetical protein SVX43_14785, partial [Cyanobacteriota bacterium]|nr:hypothetical protein [Cyanobacteriota bacterium]